MIVEFALDRMHHDNLVQLGLGLQVIGASVIDMVGQ